MRQPLVAAAAAAFLSMVVVFVVKTFADTVFLAEYGVAYLPHFFVAQAAAIIITSALYGAIIRRGPSLSADLAILAILAGTALVAPVIGDRGGAWVFAITLALLVFAALAALVVWNAATAVVSGRAARSFIPRAGAAATMGAILGGFGSSAIVAIGGVAALAPCAGTLTAILMVQVFMLARQRIERPAAKRRHRSKTQTRPALSQLSRKLIWLLVGAAIIESLLAAFIDFGFKREVSASFDRQHMGIFFALFYGVSNILLLAMQLFVAARLLAAKSLRVSLSLEPMALIAVAIGWIVAPILALAALGRGIEMIMKFGLARPAQEVALSPLPEADRQRWKVLLRGVFSQAGAATAGLLLIVAAPLLATDPAIAPACMAGLAALWLLIQRRIARRYLDTLGSALGMLRLSKGSGAGVRLDRDGLGKVIELANNDNPELTEFANEILNHVVDDSAMLAPHLGHSNPRVRTSLYRLLAADPARACLPALQRALAAEDDPVALAAGLDALAGFASPAAVDRARSLVESTPATALAELGCRSDANDQARLMTSAWAYLATVGALDDDRAALAAVLTTLLACDGARAAHLYEAALRRKLLGEAEVDEVLVRAIAEQSGEERRQGLCAAAAIGRSKPLVQLLKALDENLPGADLAVAHLDSPGMGRLIMLANARKTRARLRARLIRALRGSPLAEAREVAARALRDDDAAVRDLAVHTLLKSAREEPGDIPGALVEAALADQLDRFEVYVRARKHSGARESSIAFRHDSSLINADVFLLDELERRTEHALSRLCTLLALRGNPNKVYAAERALRAPLFGSRHRGVDILQEVARGAHRTRLFELLDLYLKPQSTPSPADLAAVYELDPWLARCATGQLAGLQSRLWYLRSTFLFDHVAGEALAMLAERIDEIEFEPHEVVVERGAPGDAAYIITRGKLTIERERAVVASLGVGQAFGELALVDRREHQATVRAVDRTRLLRLPRALFFTALETHPEIGLGLLRALAKRLRQTEPRPSPAVNDISR